MRSEYELRKEMVEIGRRLHQKDLVAASDGNLSTRLSDNQILITSSGTSLGFLKSTQLVLIDLEGRPLLSSQKPTSEYRLHLEVYRQRKDVGGVVHAHAPICTAFSVAGVTLDQCVVPEVVFSLGAIPTTDYATPTTDEPPRAIKEYICRCDAMILDRHGTLTVGSNLTEAYFKLEKIEHTARIILSAHLLGRVKVLTPEQVDKLMNTRKSLGLEGKLIRCVHCTDSSCSIDNTGDEQLVKTISSEVLKIIHG